MTALPPRGRLVSRRPAYTLLELILALSLAVLLLAGLYLAMTIQLQHSKIGRGMVQSSAQARALFGRIENDILHQLAPFRPRQNPNALMMVAGISPNGTTPTTSSSGTVSSGTTGGGGGGGGGAVSNLTPGVTNNSSGPIVFNLMVQGDSTHLSLYVSELPTELLLNSSQAPPVISDLRRVNYWLASGGGMARYEMKVATTQDALAPGVFDPSTVNEQDYLINRDVLDLSFQYWDGQEWEDTWDGTMLQSDGRTPFGPPQAIAINLTLVRANATGATPDDQRGARFRYVVYIPTANNLLAVNQQSTNNTSSSGTAGP